MRALLLVGLLFCAAGLSCADVTSTWQSVRFDENGLVPTTGNGALLVRDGYLPRLADSKVLREDQLGEGMGALAIYCYQPQSGGKLKAQPRQAPLSGAAVTVAGGTQRFAARVDAEGYLLLALPEGDYVIGISGITRNVRVESGKTASVALRSGKRMVD
jgi:hypothetical protein